ncbi:MAG TPA: hypothetical protein VFT22_26405, partial [Kofleriaceae bacterium]|nr:hypothetical protein [Kofleriaceae bacterium]
MSVEILRTSLHRNTDPEHDVAAAASRSTARQGAAADTGGRALASQRRRRQRLRVMVAIAVAIAIVIMIMIMIVVLALALPRPRRGRQRHAAGAGREVERRARGLLADARPGEVADAVREHRPQPRHLLVGQADRAVVDGIDRPQLTL